MNGNISLLSQEDMLALLECGRELSARITLEELLQSILVRASQLTDSPDTSVILRHDDREVAPEYRGCCRGGRESGYRECEHRV